MRRTEEGGGSGFTLFGGKGGNAKEKNSLSESLLQSENENCHFSSQNDNGCALCDSKDSAPTNSWSLNKETEKTNYINYYDAYLHLSGQTSPCAVPVISKSAGKCFCCDEKLSNAAIYQFEEAFRISCLKFDDNDEIHQSILYGLYFQITKSQEKPRRKDELWTNIGFQAADPIPDLRATGMLGLLLPLALFTKFKAFGEKVYSVSCSNAPFPLMVVMIVYVNETIQAAQSTDLLVGVNSIDDGWRKMLLYLAGLVNLVVSKWIVEDLDFRDNYQIFTDLAIYGKQHTKEIIRLGLMAEQETLQ